MSVATSIDKMDPSVRVLVESGKRRGFVTYEEMNQILPNDIENIDEVLTLLEELGIEILDEADVTEEHEQEARSRVEAAEEAPEAKAAPTERIDDPVRMYLTQMGEIPLLTRDQEIYLAQADRDHAQALPQEGASARASRIASAHQDPRGGRARRAGLRPHAQGPQPAGLPIVGQGKTSRDAPAGQHRRRSAGCIEQTRDDFRPLARRSSRTHGASAAG